jgi:hypothetical protein
MAPYSRNSLQNQILQDHAIFLVLIFFAIRFLASQGADSSPSALSKPYTNVAYGFALKMPADFSAYPPDASLVRG